MKHTVTLGLVQAKVALDPKANLSRTLRRIREAAKVGAEVICLQELFNTRYFPTDEKAEVAHLAQPIPGDAVSALQEAAKNLDVVIVAPIFEAGEDGRYFNSAAVIDGDGSVLGVYRKLHIPHDPFFYEQSYFEPGNLGYKIFRTSRLNFAVLICYDQWFPEAARVVALEGADVIFYPTAIGYLKNDPLPYSDWLNAWTTIQRGHAIANCVHVAVVNRVGVEGEVKFWGSSFVSDAFGKILKKAGLDEEVLIAKIDVSQNARIREGWRFTKNRRPDTYGKIVEPVRPDIPVDQGYVMPAEWEPHQSTWLAWPEDRVTFPRRLEKVREQYLNIIEVLSKNEHVNLAVKDAETRTQVRALLKARRVDLKSVYFHVWDYADVWFRDYGPTFLLNRETGKVAVVQWRFNAWGGKYPPLLKDGHVPYYISERMGMPLFRPNVILEGGAIDVNGAGALLTTEQCLLNPNRNPNMTRDKMEHYLRDYLGVSRVVWLPGGIAGDDTDGHIDNLARFVDHSTVVCAYETNTADENYKQLHENYELLRAEFDVIKLPMPPEMRDNVRGEVRRLSASYANFYIANRVVLVPTFGQKTDESALGILKEVFADRQVVGVDCRDVIYGAGALHCISQQQPIRG